MKDRIITYAVLIALSLGVIGFGLGIFGAIQPSTQARSVGAFNPTGGSTYRLLAPVSSSQNTITLSSFKEPVSGILYTMSYLNSSIEYGTLAPLTSQSEFVSFTGITQNSNGSATLTGVTRGLARSPGTSGCVASTTLALAHASQSNFIISNSPCFQAEYATLRNNQSITGVWTFSSTTPPLYDGYGPNFNNFSSTTFATVSYVDITASQASTTYFTKTGNDIHNNNIAGAVNIISYVGTSTVQGPISFLGGPGMQPYLLVATSNPPYGYIAGDLIDAGNNTNGFAAINTFNNTKGSCATSNFVMNGNIPNLGSDYFDIGFTNTGWTGVGATCLSSGLTAVRPESAYLNSVTGDMDFIVSSTTPNVGFNWYLGGGGASNKVFSLTGTSTGAFSLYGVNYQAPLSQGAANTVWKNNGSGALSWSIPSQLIATSTTATNISSSNSSTTVFSATVPANALNSGAVQVTLHVSNFALLNGDKLFICVLYASSPSCFTLNNGTGGNLSSTIGTYTLTLYGGVSASAQTAVQTLVTNTTGILTTAQQTALVNNTGSTAGDSTSAQTLSIVARLSANSGSDIFNVQDYLATLAR